jgi:hypothetical protein
MSSNAAKGKCRVLPVTRECVRACLVPMYNRFTEDRDTADLQEAKTLLEELS